MHPRSSANILATATFAPTKKTHKPAKANPLASDIGFTKFSSTMDASHSVSQPARATDPLTTADPYILPTNFKFISTSTPDMFLRWRKEEAVSEADSSYFDEFGSIHSCVFL